MLNAVDGVVHFLRIDRGEDLAGSIVSYCDERGILSAAVSGIGAVEQVELGFYDLGKKQYCRRRLEGIFELVALTGNVTRVDGKAFLHGHASLAGADFQALGGHLFGGKVAVTAEVFLVETRLPLEQVDEAIGLKLIRL